MGHNKFILCEKLPNVHAEMSAIAKLQGQRKKKLESVHLCVLRVTPTGKLNSSKPCTHCILSLGMIAPMKGYRIEKVFYSDETGSILRTRFKELDPQSAHVTRYFRERNFKMR
jgi:cytidine deaminase